MLSHTDLKKGVQFIYNNQPYEVLDFNLNFKGRGGSVAQTKIKNLITGNVLTQNFKPSDSFSEAVLTKTPLCFVYGFKDKFVFTLGGDKAKRIELTTEQIGDTAKFLKQNQEVEGLVFNDKIVSIILPIKIALKVKQAPPGVKGDRSEAGAKQIVLETNATINAPLFIKEGDVIEINTQTGEYVKRV